MLSYIALLPGVVAFYVAQNKSIQHAFIYVYLPTLLLLPDYYRAITPGLPDPTFNQSASVALFGLFLLQGAPGYKFSIMDVLVGFYAFSVSYSEYLASGYSDAQNLMFFELTSVFFPYILAKSLIEPYRQRYEFARCIVICASVILVFNLFENKFAINLWRMIFDRFFPGQGQGWLTTFRFGMARAGGPYGHALLDGIVMMVAYRLARWLQWSEAWPEKIKQLAWLPIKPAFLFSIATFGSLMTTLAKGSWLASLIAAGITFIGRSKKRTLAISALVFVILFIGIPAIIGFLNYASVGRENALTDNQETAAYRYELVVEYMDIANEQMWWGWGLTKWPKVPGMPSIDNYFLLLYLMHGFFAFSLFFGITTGMILRLLIYAMRRPSPEPRGSSLAFTLAAIYLGYFVAVATVYMGLQTVPLYFMITGWADTYIRTSTWDGGRQTRRKLRDTRRYRFKRVL